MKFNKLITELCLLLLGVIQILGRKESLSSYYKDDFCECDLTLSSCDTFCCCDPDCLKLESPPSFKCLLDRSKGSPSFPEKLCNYSSSLAPDYASFLCLQSENSPYLGYYFGDPDSAKDVPSFQSIIGSKQRFEVNNPSKIERVSFGDAYKYGDALLMGGSSNCPSFASLPKNVVDGYCNFNAPITYLEDFESECLYSEPVQYCGQNTSLLIDPDRYRFPKDCGIMSNKSGNSFAPHSTTYLCYDENRTLVNCRFGNSFPKLSYADSNYVCKNAVVGVHWTFQWSASTIISFNVTLVIDDIRPPILLRFTSTFRHYKDRQIQRSGVLGYQLHLPLLATKYTKSNKEIANIRVWKPVLSGFCSVAETETVTFGDDVTSGCLWPVSIDEFNDCDVLREKVLKKQKELFDVDQISISGNLTSMNIDASGYFVPLLKSSFSFGSRRQNETEDFLNEDGPGRCSKIPHHIKLIVLYSKMGHVNDDSVYQIAGSLLNYSYDVWSWHAKYSKYPIISSVQYVEIPVMREKKVKKFWDVPNICHQDCCWEELWYPGTLLDTPFGYEMITSTVITLMFVLPCLWVFATQLTYS